MPNTHALGVLTTDANGTVKLDTLSEATGVSQEVLDDSCSAIRADFPAAGGTVTSIATNTGTGITGGTITGSGTIAADTSLLSTRLRVQKGIDSVNVTVALRVKYTDTAIMLANYLSGMLAKVKYSDTSAMLSNYLSAVLARVKYTDTASMLSNYLSGIHARVKYTDTSAMLSNYLSGMLARVKYTDTASMLLPYQRTVNATSGTVTSVATNTGTGITGGTITSSGTIAADTVILATRQRVQKAVDSLNTVIATKGSGTVTSVAAGYGTTFTTITASGSVVVDTNKASGICTNLWRQKAVDSLNTLIAAKGAGTVTNVIAGTNISITGTSTIQPTVNITGTIAVANGGTGTTGTTSVNATPITYGSNNTITVPISTGVTGLGTGVATWAATPSSANLASALTDETGSGVAVFNDKPTFKGTIQTITAVAAQAFDGSTGNMFTRTLAASETFTQSNFSTGQNFIVRVKQGSGTSYTVTWWSGITWITSGGTAPTQTTTSNGYTTYGFTCTGSNTFDGYLVATQ